MEIPTVALTLSDTELATLQSVVNPLDHSDDYGINLYVNSGPPLPILVPLRNLNRQQVIAG